MESIKEDLQKTGKYMMNYGLAWGTAGNISARTQEEKYLITASGTFLGELESDDLIECDLYGNVVGASKRKPSKEIPMHQAVYENRPDIGAVLHSSPFYSTLIACSSIEIPSNLFIESMYYLEKVERVPYFEPGSKELGEGVREKVKKANVLLLENHGVLVYDENLKEARMALQTLELTCKMLVNSRAAGIDFNNIQIEQEKKFLNQSVYKPRRDWTGQ